VATTPTATISTTTTVLAGAKTTENLRPSQHAGKVLLFTVKTKCGIVGEHSQLSTTKSSTQKMNLQLKKANISSLDLS